MSTTREVLVEFPVLGELHAEDGVDGDKLSGWKIWFEGLFIYLFLIFWCREPNSGFHANQVCALPLSYITGPSRLLFKQQPERLIFK